MLGFGNSIETPLQGKQQRQPPTRHAMIDNVVKGNLRRTQHFAMQHDMQPLSNAWASSDARVSHSHGTSGDMELFETQYAQEECQQVMVLDDSIASVCPSLQQQGHTPTQLILQAGNIHDHDSINCRTLKPKLWRQVVTHPVMRSQGVDLPGVTVAIPFLCLVNSLHSMHCQIAITDVRVALPLRTECCLHQPTCPPQLSPQFCHCAQGQQLATGPLGEGPPR